MNATYSRGYHEEGATSLPVVAIFRQDSLIVNGELRPNCGRC